MHAESPYLPGPIPRLDDDESERITEDEPLLIRDGIVSWQRLDDDD